jgi:hypothetical protein
MRRATLVDGWMRGGGDVCREGNGGKITTTVPRVFGDHVFEPSTFNLQVLDAPLPRLRSTLRTWEALYGG